MRRFYTAKLVWLQRWKTIMVIINVHLCYFSNQWKKNSLVGMNMYNCIIWIWLIMVLICSSDYNLPAAVWHFSITINVDRMFDDAMTHFSVLKKVSSGRSCKCWRRIVMCMYSVLPHMLPFAKKNFTTTFGHIPFFLVVWLLLVYSLAAQLPTATAIVDRNNAYFPFRVRTW